MQYLKGMQSAFNMKSKKGRFFDADILNTLRRDGFEVSFSRVAGVG